MLTEPPAQARQQVGCRPCAILVRKHPVVIASQNPSKNPNGGCGADGSGVMTVTGKVDSGNVDSGKVLSGKAAVTKDVVEKGIVSTKGEAIGSAGSDTTGMTGRAGAADNNIGVSGTMDGTATGIAVTGAPVTGNDQNRTDASKLPVTSLCDFGS